MTSSASGWCSVCEQSPPHLALERRGALLWVTIDRPAARNALNTQTRRELRRAFEAAQDDAGVRCVVLRSTGDRAFCAGQDVREAQQFDAEGGAAWQADYHRLYNAMRALEKPLLAVVQAAAYGAGFSLALACDLRLLGEHASLGMAEIKVGLPTIAGTFFLWEALGGARTRDLILTGRNLTATEAVAWGLGRGPIPAADLESEAARLAEELAATPPLAQALNKRRWREMTEAAFQGSFAEAQRIGRISYGSGEPQAAMRAFLAGRQRRGGSG